MWLSKRKVVLAAAPPPPTPHPPTPPAHLADDVEVQLAHGGHGVEAKEEGQPPAPWRGLPLRPLAPHPLCACTRVGGQVDRLSRSP